MKNRVTGGDEYGGGLRMSNFFKELALAEKKIVVENEFLNGQEVVTYKDSTRQILLFLIQTVESGRLVGASESGRFICKNFRKNAVELTNLWNSNDNNRRKSANTFRSQVSTLSNKMYRLFGNNIYSIFCSQDEKGLHRLSQLLTLIQRGELRSSDLFYTEMLQAGADSGNFPSQNVALEDCKPELRFLRQILKVRIMQLIEQLDSEKLQYIQYVLNQPLVEAKTMKLNRDKANLLISLGVVSLQESDVTHEKEVCN
jgi:hypothetical protein